MIGGVLRITAPGVPADAPADEPGITPWFSGAQAPVQIGVYQRLSLSDVLMYSYWTGDAWLWNHRDATCAARVPATMPSMVQNLPWRGRVAPPPYGYAPVASEVITVQEGAPC